MMSLKQGETLATLRTGYRPVVNWDDALLSMTKIQDDDVSYRGGYENDENLTTTMIVPVYPRVLGSAVSDASSLLKPRTGGTRRVVERHRI